MPATYFEVLFLDGLGAWRRWATKAAKADAERSADRCRKFMAGAHGGRPTVKVERRGS